MIYTKVTTCVVNEDFIIQTFMRDLENGKYVLDHLQHGTLEWIFNKEEVEMQVPVTITTKYNEETTTEEVWAKLHMTISLEYNPRAKQREYFHVYINELTIDIKGILSIIPDDDDELIVRVENGIYYSLWGMYLEKYGNI